MVVKRRDAARWFAAAASILALLGGFGTLTATLTKFLVSERTPRIVSPSDRERSAPIDELRKELTVQRETIARLDSSFKEIASAPVGSNLGAQLAAVRADLAAASKRLDGLEAAILDTPTKALAVPLLRQDLEGLKSSYQRDIDASKREIDRIYDQNKWFIGLMFSMAVGLIGLAISNFVQARKRTG